MGQTLHRWSHERLLDTRLCDLPIDLESSWVAPLIDKVKGEIVTRGLRTRPHFYFADEWFSPENIPGVAVPFYLGHGRLMRLERRMMLEVEGGTRTECLRLIRHELGHAVQHAYRLHRRRRWQQMFGKATARYPDYYRPKPASRDFVVHLDGWYAQSHPVEDFAETFAVWLDPRSGWRARYRNWPALKKLQYVDDVMRELEGVTPPVRSRMRPYALSTSRHTLAAHYEKRRSTYDIGYTDRYDRDLLRVFDAKGRGEKAAVFLRRHRQALRRQVARKTGGHDFTVDQVYKEMSGRCRELRLGLNGARPERKKNEFASLLATHTMYTLHQPAEWRAV